MDHLDADKTKAVERYMLGDLSVSEVEEFERHFFDCPQCSEELRVLTIFQENARAVFGEQDPAPIPPSVPVPKSAAGWWRGFSPLFWKQPWAVALAALVIGIFTGYMAFTMREGVQAVGEYPLYAQARGEETMVSPAARSKIYVVYFDKTWESDYASLRAVVRDASGVEQFSVSVPPVAPGEAFHIKVPTRKLSPGKYLLVMMGSNGDKESELAQFPYTLQIK
jgi:anti-sigma factor RsiW